MQNEIFGATRSRFGKARELRPTSCRVRHLNSLLQTLASWRLRTLHINLVLGIRVKGAPKVSATLSQNVTESRQIKTTNLSSEEI